MLSENKIKRKYFLDLDAWCRELYSKLLGFCPSQDTGRLTLVMNCKLQVLRATENGSVQAFHTLVSKIMF